LIESGYDPRVTSSAGAVGMWQLMPSTARGLGLEVTPLIDERRHPEKSTDAAVRYLQSLQSEFGSWFVTLAAYNWGPTRVRGLLRRHAPGTTPSDSLFWALRDLFPRETREFVPKMYGAMWVASRPSAYGYDAPVPEPWVFDLVRVPEWTTLDMVSRATGVPRSEIAWLNPEFIVGVTPPDRSTTLRVPPGRGGILERNYEWLADQESAALVEHAVRAGDTVSGIAGLYGVDVAVIVTANPGLRPEALVVGMRLKVPVLVTDRGEGPRG